jgi:hypothetical protein
MKINLFFQRKLREEVTQREGDHSRQINSVKVKQVKRIGYSDHKRLVTNINNVFVLLIRNKLLHNGNKTFVK